MEQDIVYGQTYGRTTDERVSYKLCLETSCHRPINPTLRPGDKVNWLMTPGENIAQNNTTCHVFIY